MSPQAKPELPAPPPDPRTVIDARTQMASFLRRQRRFDAGCVLLSSSYLLATILLIAIAVAFGALAIERHRYQKAAEAYLAKAIPVLSSWDAERAKTLMAPEVAAQENDSDLRRTMLFFKPLGQLKSFDKPRFQGASKIWKIPYPALLSYTVTVHYTAGDAHEVFRLVPNKNGSLSLWSFFLSSKSLLPPDAASSPEKRTSPANRVPPNLSLQRTPPG